VEQPSGIYYKTTEERRGEERSIAAKPATCLPIGIDNY
jgi:hypothetical protein